MAGSPLQVIMNKASMKLNNLKKFLPMKKGDISRLRQLAASKANMKQLMRITRLQNGKNKGQVALAAIAVFWSALTCDMMNVGVANAAEWSEATRNVKINTTAARLGGIPYRNKLGEIVVSGSVSENDAVLMGCQPEAQLAYNAARASEPVITFDMLDLSHQLNTTMDGLEYSVKTASSVKSKIDRKTHKALKAGLSPKADFEYVGESGDLIRYTQLVPHQQMADYTRRTLSLLEDKGYTVTKIDNKYLNKEGRYKAIHLDIAAPSGQRFEMQIHSEQTLQANRATHPLYEEWRRPETSPERKAELFQSIKAAYDALPIPDNIESIANYEKA